MFLDFHNIELSSYPCDEFTVSNISVEFLKQVEISSKQPYFYLIFLTKQPQ
jgi:hypothetical protein